VNARDDWPAAEDVADWWLQRPLTPDELQALADEYQYEQIASAQSDAAFAANVKEYNK
jgi:hypothetical protein